MYLFLSGADMEPTAVRASYPDARFVARSRITADGAPIAPLFAPHLDGEVWCILIQVTSPVAAIKRSTATTDDGRTLSASLAGDPLVGGAPEEALAAARYWELPPLYVARLKSALAAT